MTLRVLIWQLSQEDVQALCHDLKTNHSSLTHLDLSACGLTTSSLDYIKRALMKNTRLVGLNLAVKTDI